MLPSALALRGVCFYFLIPFLCLFSACSNETTVLFYDDTPAETGSKPKKVTGKSVPATPTNLAAAKKQLEDKQADSEEDRYVYLPPGSSMRDPGDNSMSDPLERKVYYRDPIPATKKK